MARSWLSDERSALAIDRILDAAASLYVTRGPSAVSMNDVAEAAGCGRTTLYRYFENRQTLQLAYAAREAGRLAELAAARTADISDPAQRLAEAILTIADQVRSTPAVASWFEFGDAELILEVVKSPQVTEVLTAHYLPGTSGTDARADWLFRGVLSLLMYPPTDPERERQLVTEFLVPTLLGGSAEERT